MTRTAQKDMECWVLRKFLLALGLGGPVPVIENKDPPDFVVRIDGKRVGFELAELHQGPARKSGSVRRRFEEGPWRSFRELLCKESGRHPQCDELKHISAWIRFTRLQLPPSADCDRLAAELVSAVAQGIPTVKNEKKCVLTEFSQFPLTAKYVSAVQLAHCASPPSCPWECVNVRVASFGLAPVNLAALIREKSKKLPSYKANSGTDDIRLLIYAQDISAATFAPSGAHLQDDLLAFVKETASRRALEQSGFREIWFYNLMDPENPVRMFEVCRDSVERPQSSVPVLASRDGQMCVKHRRKR